MSVWVGCLAAMGWGCAFIWGGLLPATAWGGATAYSTASQDPDERVAAKLNESLNAIESKLRRASMDQDPNQDNDLQDAVAECLMTHKQLAENASRHQIPPPDLDGLRVICASLSDRHEDEIKQLKQAITEVEEELQQAKALRQTLTLKIKGNLALNLTAGMIDVMTKAVTIVGGAPSMGLAQAASLVNEFMVDIVLPSSAIHSPFASPTTDRNAGVSLQTQNQRFRRLYEAHKQEIDQRIATWIDETYFSAAKQGIPLKTPGEYVELLKRDAEKRAALQRRFLEEMRQMLGKEIIPGREDLLNKQKAELLRLEGKPGDPNFKSYYPQYKVICEKILRLSPWTLTRTASAGVIEFALPRYSVLRSAGKAKITVVRTGGTSGIATTDYASVDGSANAGTDYRAASGTLHWGDAEGGGKTFEVFILDDRPGAPATTLTLQLANPGGGVQLGAKLRAELTINDDRQVASPRPDEQAERKDPEKPVVCNYLKIAPQGLEVLPGRSIAFTALAIYTDATTRDVTAFVTWYPGASYTTPADLRFNEKIKVTATYREGSTVCTGSTEITALAPSWSPPLSHADDLGARGETPGPMEFNHYVLCDLSGHVVTGKNTSPALFGIMHGPVGPRNAEQWIPQNCPSKLCIKEGATGVCAREPPLAPTGGDAYYALCNQAGQIIISRSASLPGHVTMTSQGLTGETGARWWIEKNCPSWACTSSGACASAGQVRTGGKWAVVCDRRHGGIGLTEHPSIVDHWIKVEHLLSDRDALNWIAANCPSERCDPDGRCLPGNAPLSTTAQGRPVEVPAGAVLEMFGQRESSRQAGGRSGFGSYWGQGGRFSSDTLSQQMQRDGQMQSSAAGAGGGSSYATEQHCQTDASCAAGYRCQGGHCVPGAAAGGLPTGAATSPGSSGGSGAAGVAPVQPATTTTAGAGGTRPQAVPAGTYEPKGSGQPCLQVGQQMEARCRQMSEDCNRRNCSGGGYSGCALDCPGCGGYFGDYVAWCPLHPSYESKVSAGLSSFVSEIKVCIDQFLADGKAGRRERGAECQGKAQKRLNDKKDAWVQQACQARCAQDGRNGVAVLGGARHRCECR